MRHEVLLIFVVHSLEHLWSILAFASQRFLVAKHLVHDIGDVVVLRVFFLLKDLRQLGRLLRMIDLKLSHERSVLWDDVDLPGQELLLLQLLLHLVHRIHFSHLRLLQSDLWRVSEEWLDIVVVRVERRGVLR